MKMFCFIFAIVSVCFCIRLILVHIPDAFNRNAEVGKAIWYFNENDGVNDTIINAVVHTGSLRDGVVYILTDDNMKFTYIDYLKGKWGFFNF